MAVMNPGYDPSNYRSDALRTEAPIDIVIEERMVKAARLWHALSGLSDEVGELHKDLKAFCFYGKPLDRTRAKEEAGDVLWYLNLFLDEHGLTLEVVMQAIIDKLRARFPDKFTEQAANTRDLAKEYEALGGQAIYDDLNAEHDVLNKPLPNNVVVPPSIQRQLSATGKANLSSLRSDEG